MHTPPSAVHKHLLVDVPGRGFGAFFLSFYSMKESIAIVQMIPEVARNRSNMDAWSPKSLLDVRSITCENPIGPMRMPDRPKKLLAVQSITSMNTGDICQASSNMANTMSKTVQKKCNIFWNIYRDLKHSDKTVYLMIILYISSFITFF